MTSHDTTLCHHFSVFIYTFWFLFPAMMTSFKDDPWEFCNGFHRVRDIYLPGVFSIANSPGPTDAILEMYQRNPRRNLRSKKWISGPAALTCGWMFRNSISPRVPPFLAPIMMTRGRALLRSTFGSWNTTTLLICLIFKHLKKILLIIQVGIKVWQIFLWYDKYEFKKKC